MDWFFSVGTSALMPLSDTKKNQSIDADVYKKLVAGWNTTASTGDAGPRDLRARPRAHII